MKFTLSWLKDHLDTDATLDQIVETLTMIGLEVEEVDNRAAFKPFMDSYYLLFCTTWESNTQSSKT